MAPAEVCHDPLVDLPRKEAFKAADDFPFGPTVCRASGHIVDGGLVMAHADHDGSVEGGVRVTVTAPIESVPTGGHPGRGWDRTRAAELGECGFRANPIGIVPEDNQHRGCGVRADGETLTEGWRRLGGKSREMPVMHRDFVGESEPATGQRPEHMLA